jgi:hypothetical protein
LVNCISICLNIFFFLFALYVGDSEDSSRPDFAGFAKQSRYVAPSYAHSTKYKEPKYQVLCLAG